MYLKSSRTPLFILLLCFFYSLSFSQSAIHFTGARATEAEKLIYDQHFKDYQVATLQTAAVAEMLSTGQKFDKLTVSFGNAHFAISLEAFDIRAPHYKLRELTDSGAIEHPRSANTTYSGFTENGHYDVRITSSPRSFYGMIGLSHDILFIEPARYIAPDAPADQYVIYLESDALTTLTMGKCGTHEQHTMQYHPEEEEAQHDHASDQRNRACKIVQIALADDFRMFNEYGSVADVEDHNMAVINNVQTNYDFEFSDDLQFLVVEIVVATNDNNDPWSNSNDIGDVLDSFTGWGPTGFDNTHDVGSLWSARNFNGDVIGLAWLNAVCKSFRYNVVEDFTGNASLLRVLQAHELGHNFGANHDAENAPFIMAPSVSMATNWSTASINSIDNYIAGINCLGPCGTPQPPVANFSADPTEGCAPMTVFFDDESTNNPTSWSWSFPGGSPSSSSNQNPTVTYNSPGSYNVTLTVSNNQGSNTLTMNNYIVVGEAPFADFDFQINDFEVDFDNQSDFADTYFWTFGDGGTSTNTNPIHEYDEDGIYTVTLTATNDCGSDTYSVEIEIITEPFADFTSSDPEGCSPFEVDFYNWSSENADSYLWSFPGGSPSSSTDFEPTVLYEIPGVYNVTLVVFNEAGQDSYTQTNYIEVYATPNAVFTSVANGLSYTFNSAGSVGENYMWNFGDGQTSTNQNPTHVYASGGTYTVTLTVTNDCGTDVFSSVINVVGAPIADFASNIQSGCGPLVVQFQSHSLGNPTSYSWTFEGGNPATSNIPNPVVTYNSPGVFDVSLTVTNAVGNNTLTLDDFIQVFPNTFSDFSVFQNGAEITLNNASQNATSYVWSFGDGEMSTQTNPVHIYNADGTYTVVLVAVGTCGNDTSSQVITIQTPPQAGFELVQNDFCAPATVSFTNESSANATSFAWTFQGGSPATSSAENPTVTYNNPGLFNVTLIAYSAGGSDTMTWLQLVEIGNVPNAAFLLSTNSLTINFENQTVDGDTYVWLFGDGTNSIEENPTHEYAEFGTYVVSLIATNECGNDTMEVVVELGTVPNAFFSYNAHNGCAPFEIQFIDQSQNNPTSWLWTFEGGTPETSTEQNPLITYQTPGDYFVSLRASNAEGSDVLVLDDVISIAGTPDATFSYSQTDNTVFLDYFGIDYDSLRWSFGDGRSDNSLNPTVMYHVTGFYDIQLIVYNACGSDTTEITVEIIISSTSSIPSLDGNWQIRPNPFHESLVLFGETEAEGALQVVLRDAQGRLLHQADWDYHQGSNWKEIHAAKLPAGVIFVELRSKTARTILKAVHL